MKDSTSTNSCARELDLVTYLYGEATRDEARAFEKHLPQCSSCRTELMTFGDVREAMGEWRQQALGSLAPAAVEAPAVVNRAPVRGRSALGALREFFTLSPVWLRAATGVAALLFCALAVIAVAYFVQQPRTQIVEKTVNAGYTQQEVEAQIAAALRQQNESRLKDRPEQVTVTSNEQPGVQIPTRRQASVPPQLVKNNRRQQVAPRAIVARASKMELASTDFLPFTAQRDEEKLPSLTDLVDDDDDDN
jgi:anti-sigma factor RsiW